LKSFPDDLKLVEMLQKGNVEAFDLIYEKYSMKLYIFGLKYLRSSAEAEELVQAVFLKVWENHKSLKKESSFKSYLYTITYNDICKLFRERNYHQKFIMDALAENPQSSFDIGNSIDYKSVLDRVQQIIDKLPDRQRTIFLKSRMENKSTKEIAEELDLSPGTVDNYISEALKFIRNKFHNRNFSLLLFFSLFLI